MAVLLGLRHGAAPCFMRPGKASRPLCISCWNRRSIPTLPRRVPQEGHALFDSCAGNHLETAQLLLENGADPNGDSNSSGSGYGFVQHKHPYHYHAMQALLSWYGTEVPDWIKDPGDFISNIPPSGTTAKPLGFILYANRGG